IGAINCPDNLEAVRHGCQIDGRILQQIDRLDHDVDLFFCRLFRSPLQGIDRRLPLHLCTQAIYPVARKQNDLRALQLLRCPHLLDELHAKRLRLLRHRKPCFHPTDRIEDHPQAAHLGHGCRSLRRRPALELTDQFHALISCLGHPFHTLVERRLLFECPKHEGEPHLVCATNAMRSCVQTCRCQSRSHTHLYEFSTIHLALRVPVLYPVAVRFSRAMCSAHSSQQNPSRAANENTTSP